VSGSSVNNRDRLVEGDRGSAALVTWREFEEAAPELAAAGARLFGKHGIAYLATVRRDGAPRVHPVVPIIAQGRVFVAVGPRSPKRHELLRDGRYALHALPGKDDEEFLISGRAFYIQDSDLRSAASAAADHIIHDYDLLFEFTIERCLWGIWENVGQPNTRPIRKRWRAR